MKGAVIYFSKWGNCRRISEEIAEGLRLEGLDVIVSSVDDLTGLDRKLDFLVIGSPTRIGKMTMPVRRFIKREITDAWDGKPFAAFGTGLQQDVLKQEPQGADDVRQALLAKGLEPLMPAFKASVTGMRGPLAEGEEERAREFGRELARTVRLTAD